MTATGFTAFDSNWYDYPPELRKYIILAIVRSQEPVGFTGFGIFGCNLEVFAKVTIHYQLFFVSQVNSFVD